jgi:hypothetical protein
MTKRLGVVPNVPTPERTARERPWPAGARPHSLRSQIPRSRPYFGFSLLNVLMPGREESISERSVCFRRRASPGPTGETPGLSRHFGALTRHGAHRNSHESRETLAVIE